MLIIICRLIKFLGRGINNLFYFALITLMHEFHPSRHISRYPLLYRILASQSSSGKLGGREVCTSKQEVVGSNPDRVACGFFSQTLGKH